MTTRDRVLAALRGDEVDRVPMSFWGHVYHRESSASELVDHTLERWRQHRWDWIKLNPRKHYHVEPWGVRYRYSGVPNEKPELDSYPVHTAADWDAIREVPHDEGALGEHLEAVRSLRAMFDHGVKSRDGRAMDQGGVFPFITSWLFQSLALVHEGRLLLDSGTSARDLAGKLGVNNFGDRFTEQVRNNPLPRLRHGLLALLHCQRMLRLSSEEPVVLLERFLAQWFDGVPVPTARELEW